MNGDRSPYENATGELSEPAKLMEELRALREREETYRQLLDDSSDPIFCFYPDGRYKYVNKAFALGTRKDQDFIIGRTIWDVFSKEEADKRFAVVKWVVENAQVKEIEVRVPTPGHDRFYLTTVKPAFGKNGEVTTVMCISKEITERKRTEEERERMIAELQKALSEIKQLSGLLPICAACKKIRNDAGYWEQVESYFSTHTDVKFTHGICPSCVEELYSEYVPKK